MGDVTTGRRIPVQDGAQPFAMVTDPGDYYGPVADNVDNAGERAVWFLLPVARDEDAPSGLRSVHRITSPPWEFRECDDGSLEIRASILAEGVDARSGTPYSWHGFLDEGHCWRAV